VPGVPSKFIKGLCNEYRSNSSSLWTDWFHVNKDPLVNFGLQYLSEKPDDNKKFKESKQRALEMLNEFLQIGDKLLEKRNKEMELLSTILLEEKELEQLCLFGQSYSLTLS
jgi:hypothetical protein